MSELLRVDQLQKVYILGSSFGGRRCMVRAVNGVSFTIGVGETLGLVGESGCGKSTLGRLALRLIPPTSGEVFFEGQSIYSLPNKRMTELRREMQIIFQDPFGSLNPKMKVGKLLSEPLINHSINGNRKERLAQLLDFVGLPPDTLSAYPGQLSGGQQQRVAIARALATEPKFIVCDEPVSALDVSIRAQVLNLFLEIQRRLGISYLFISHDLSVIRHISDRVAVMYLGKIVELAPNLDLFAQPKHPYTEALLSAILLPDPDEEARRHRIILKGDIPSPINLPPGCAFHTRCLKAVPECRLEVPELKLVCGSQHFAACHLAKRVGS
ncbi:MAG: ABC transporter ATP-binding protein [Chloroflexi bacterium]|nr:ABC transporter ATP-binding protein [Chloroflexota bacterium]